MRCKELDQAIVVVRRLLASRTKVKNDPRLHAALRELEMIKKGGKLDKRRIGRAVEKIAVVLEEEVLTTDETR